MHFKTNRFTFKNFPPPPPLLHPTSGTPRTWYSVDNSRNSILFERPIKIRFIQTWRSKFHSLTDQKNMTCLCWGQRAEVIPPLHWQWAIGQGVSAPFQSSGGYWSAATNSTAASRSSSISQQYFCFKTSSPQPSSTAGACPPVCRLRLRVPS